MTRVSKDQFYGNQIAAYVIEIGTLLDENARLSAELERLGAENAQLKKSLETKQEAKVEGQPLDAAA